MSHNPPIDLFALKDVIINGMISYMEADGDSDDFEYYSQEDVDKCNVILLNYLNNVSTSSIHGDSEKIMAAVEETVIALNLLNENCDHSMIETGERESICELIINAAAQAGLETDEYDITEQWRDW
jgi:hypothetical protein